MAPRKKDQSTLKKRERRASEKMRKKSIVRKMKYRDERKESGSEYSGDEVAAARSNGPALSHLLPLFLARPHRATPIMSIYTITIQQFEILMIHTTLNNLNSCWP